MTVMFDGAYGPNLCKISHDPQAQRIFVESDYILYPENMLDIEVYLGLNTALGKRWVITEAKDDFGRTLTIWNYLESTDCDWS